MAGGSIKSTQRICLTHLGGVKAVSLNTSKNGRDGRTGQKAKKI